MDWRTIDFDWNRARAFLVTAEEGSLTAAAAALNTTQPTIGRQVTALEAELGVVLFERVGNRLQVTDAGLDLLEHVRAMGEAATRFSLRAAGEGEVAEGLVAITASDTITAHLLPPILARIREEHPRIVLELVASNDVRDLTRREADIAVRNTRPDQPGLVARRLPDATARPYATPGHLEAVGGDLLAATYIGFDRDERLLAVYRHHGLDVPGEQLAITSRSHLAQWALARRGLGICIMMEAVGDADPGMVRVSPDIALPVPMSLISHPEVHTARPVRVVFDALADGLTEALTGR
ncbi:MAG: LysR family transcriptional regulator [Myxococcales bacterium]|nr:LysR family transcriptional regulator [Myxococcales bacterium]